MYICGYVCVYIYICVYIFEDRTVPFVCVYVCTNKNKGIMLLSLKQRDTEVLSL